MDNASTPSPDAPLAGHTISVVSERTGLSRDVLRVWERRYQAVSPARTAGGQRLYSDEQLARFQLLATLSRNGRSIGSIAPLSTPALARLAADDEAARPRPQSVGPSPDAAFRDMSNRAGSRRDISQRDVSHPDGSLGDGSHPEAVDLAVEHARALDSSRLERDLRRFVGRNGLAVFIEEFVPALMRRVGDDWAAGRLGIPHEHLASAVVLAILLEAVRAVPEAPGAPQILVATPAGEQHVVGAALIAAAAALDGWSVLYLGANLPAADLATASQGARAVALSIVHAHDVAHTVREVLAVRATMPASVPLIVGGAAAVRLQQALEHPGITVCRDIREARGRFAEIAGDVG